MIRRLSTKGLRGPAFNPSTFRFQPLPFEGQAVKKTLVADVEILVSEHGQVQ